MIFDDEHERDEREEPSGPDEPSDDRLFRYDKHPAFHWGFVFCGSIAATLLFDDWVQGTYGPICIGDTYRDCHYAPVAIADYALFFFLPILATTLFWMLRGYRQEEQRDAHPWLVTVAGWIGLVVAVFALGWLSSLLGDALGVVKRALMIPAALGILMTGVGLATLIKPKHPKTWWVRAATLLIPLVAIGSFTVEYRSPGDLAERRVARAQRAMHSAIDSTRRKTNAFPKHQHRTKGTQWLSQPVSPFSDAHREVLDEVIGEVDAVGTGREFAGLVRHVLVEAAQHKRTPLDEAVQLAERGILQTAYVVGRRGDGYCLLQRKTQVDPDEPFAMAGSHPYPVISTSGEPVYCVFDASLYRFDGPKRPPTKVAELTCPPRSAPSPYAREQHEQLAHQLLRDGSPEALDDLCSEDAAPTDEHKRPALPESLESSSWGREAAAALGVATVDTPDKPFGDISLGDKIDVAAQALANAQHAAIPPDVEPLRPLFGEVLDSHSTQPSTRRSARLSTPRIAAYRKPKRPSPSSKVASTWPSTSSAKSAPAGASTASNPRCARAKTVWVCAPTRRGACATAGPATNW
jgi:hypothetical protein